MKRNQFITALILPVIGLHLPLFKSKTGEESPYKPSPAPLKTLLPGKHKVADAAEALIRQVQSKTFRFDKMSAGDCEMQDAVLILYSDGNAMFDAMVWTNHTHSGDQWHHSIEIMDYRGLKLFTIGNLDGPPRMNDGGPRYKFGPGWRKFDPQFFDAAQQATSYGSC